MKEKEIHSFLEEIEDLSGRSIHSADENDALYIAVEASKMLARINTMVQAALEKIES